MPATPAQAWLSLLVLGVCYVFPLLDRLILSLLVEPLKADLSLSDLQIGWLQGPAFAVLYATMGVPLGRLADLVNRFLARSFSLGPAEIGACFGPVMLLPDCSARS